MRRFLAIAVACALLAACGAADQSEPVGLEATGTGTTGADAGMSLSTSAADGVSIHYDDQGAGELSLLFVHGWSCDRGYWSAQRDDFARKYRVVTVDLAGHGESSDNRADFSIPAFGGDVAAVAEALDLRNIVLVGHSMGGSVVLEAARQLGSRVAAVVAVDTLRDISRRPVSGQFTNEPAMADQEFVTEVKGFLAGMFVEQSDPVLRETISADMLAQPIPVAKSASLGLRKYDAYDGVRALRVPLVLINSDYRPTNLAPIEELTDAVQYIEMTGVGHFVMMEDPVSFNRHLDGVIAALSL